jgi:hypothetical protein
MRPEELCTPVTSTRLAMTTFWIAGERGTPVRMLSGPLRAAMAHREIWGAHGVLCHRSPLHLSQATAAEGVPTNGGARRSEIPALYEA